MRDDRSTLNPAGAARRRLIKAAGLGLVASQVSFDWRKPSVSIGSTPAHAQPSVTPAACTVGFTVSMSANASSQSYSIQLVSEGTGDSGFGTGTSVNASADVLRTLTASYVQPSDDTIINDILYSVRSLGTIDLTWSATCCTADFSASTQITGPSNSASSTGVASGFASWASEDGECSLGLPS